MLLKWELAPFASQEDPGRHLLKLQGEEGDARQVAQFFSTRCRPPFPIKGSEFTWGMYVSGGTADGARQLASYLDELVAGADKPATTGAAPVRDGGERDRSGGGFRIALLYSDGQAQAARAALAELEKAVRRFSEEILGGSADVPEMAAVEKPAHRPGATVDVDLEALLPGKPHLYVAAAVDVLEAVKDRTGTRVVA